MKKVSLEAVKALREKTSASLADVRNALESAGGDEQKAMELLRQRGVLIAEKRQGRSTGQGRIESYVHHDGRLASLVEVNCETDFVARTPEFAQFCRDIAMQVAAMNPRYVRKDELPGASQRGADALAACLLEQPFVKDPGTTISALLTALIAKTGENVAIRRFVRFAVGDAATNAS
jgi:elongation factor Ts